MLNDYYEQMKDYDPGKNPNDSLVSTVAEITGTPGITGFDTLTSQKPDPNVKYLVTKEIKVNKYRLKK